MIRFFKFVQSNGQIEVLNTLKIITFTLWHDEQGDHVKVWWESHNGLTSTWHGKDATRLLAEFTTLMEKEDA